MKDRLKQDGAVLLITLLIIAVLSGLAIDFSYQVFTDTSSVSNWINAQRASLLALSAQRVAVMYIKKIRDESFTDIRKLDIPLEEDFGIGAKISVSIEDENSRFNINSIIYPNGRTNEKALNSLQKLLEFLNINPDLALSIADWIDPDAEPRAYYSEDNAKNDYLWSINELRLINGITEGIYKKIEPYVTVYGDGLININTADIPVLISLSEGMTRELAERIIEYRETGPFKDKNHIVRVPGMEKIGIEILDRITVKSSCFRISSLSVVDDVPREIRSVVDTSLNILSWKEI